MIDKNAIANELTEMFVEYQWRLDNPMPLPSDTAVAWIEEYRHDPLFHRKVQRIVSGVMYVLNKHT